MMIGLIPILFLIVWLLAQIIGSAVADFSVFLVFGSVIGFYLLWMHTISRCLDLVNIKKGLNSSSKKNNILLIILLALYLLRMIISLPYLKSIESFIGMTLNILIGGTGIILIAYLSYKISDDYIFLIKSRPANFFDYFIMIFYFSFYPIGLLMLYSHVRLLLKDNNIIEK